MPSTYTDNGGIELPANGEQASTWGNTVNVNMQIVDRLTNGVGAITLSGTTHALTTSNGVVSDGQYKVLVLGGSPSGTNTITVAPNDAQHLYIVKNNSGQTAAFTQGSGANISVLSGTTKIIYCDGAGSGAAVVDVTGSLDLGALIVGGTTVTATGTELNILDGVTSTTAELNILDGVTSTTAELNILDGVTATTAEINILDGVTATTAELNILDGVTATAAELNYVDGVTSSIQTQVDAKAANTTQATAVWETGTATTETIVSPANVKAAIIALYSEASAPDFTTQTNFNSGVTTAAHGLGAVPSRWEVKIVCTSSNVGYAVGDVISLTSHNEGNGARGNTASVNATNIQIAGNSIYVIPKAGGGVSVITNSSWDVILECWK